MDSYDEAADDFADSAATMTLASIRRSSCCPKARVPIIRRLIAMLLCVAAWTTSEGSAAEDVQAALDAYRRGEFETAYQLLLPVATGENPRIQNWVGVLTYMGRGTEADAIAAHDLFHDAADSGVEDARHNLGILHSIGADGVPVDYAEARAWFTISATHGHEDNAPPDASVPDLPRGVTTVIDDELEASPLGQYTYSVFCAGCHGFNGMHVFPHAPSFSMGERMIKSDEELLESIVDGKGMMPAWGNKLPRSHLLAALQFLRELSLRTGYGTRSTSWSDVSDFYFIFHPTGVDGGNQVDRYSDPVLEN